MAAHWNSNSRPTALKFSHTNWTLAAAHGFGANENETKVSMVCSSAVVPHVLSEQTGPLSSSSQFTGSATAGNLASLDVQNPPAACVPMNTPHGASLSPGNSAGLSSAFAAKNVGTDLSEDVLSSSAAHDAGVAAFS